MSIIRIGGEAAEYLSIAVTARTYPGCTDYHDGNWLSAVVDVAAGGFWGSASGDIRAEELVSFHEQLGQLNGSLKGTAEFETLENWLTIRVIGNGLGHLEFHCQIRDQPGIGNTLECKLALDQSYLRPLLAQLAETIREFPVMGEAR